MGGSVAEATDEVIPGEKDTNAIVVYFSREGVIPDDIDAVASASLNSNRFEAGSDTEAAAKPESLDPYDVIYVGYPIWLAYHNLIQCTQG